MGPCIAAYFTQFTLGRAEKFFQLNDTFLACDRFCQEIADASEIDTVSLTPGEVDALLVFLRALTDPASIDLRHLVPYQVPSGLPVWD